MDLFKQGMKGPSRPAPAVPGMVVSRYSPVTNWNDDPFGADVFEPTPKHAQKKKPPPRPPPPKVSKHPDVTSKPSHFIRKPTVLSSLLTRKNKNTVNYPSANPSITNVNSEVDTHKMFPKCERVNIQMGTLIDLSSPPSSPTFTTRSSSDGVSVDSFGSDATTSTNHHNTCGGNASQAESGFEDDFDLFLHSRKPISKDDTMDDFTNVDPFSPVPNKPPVMKKPIFNLDSFETSSIISSSQYSVTSLKGPTIIRAKPARPKPPDNSALLKSTFGSNFQLTSMNVNTTTPIQKISNGFADNLDSKSDFAWDSESPERESTPPMPTIPPPPPPLIVDDDLPVVWPEDVQEVIPDFLDHGPYAIALFDYHPDHQEDLCFSANTRINLIRRENDAWMYGRLQNGTEGLFPSNYVEIKVPLPNERPNYIGQAIALYDFEPMQAGDLRFSIGDKIKVLSKINEEWHFGECNGIKGQFPANYVQMS